MTSLLRAAVVCLGAVCLVATGCGSDTKKSNDYIDAVNKVQTTFVSDVKKVGSSAPAGSDPAAAAQKTFTDLQAAVEKAINDLRGVTPPAKVKTLHSQLVQEMADFDSQVKTAGASLKSKNAQKILAAQTKFAAAAGSIETRLSTTLDAINKKLRG